MLRRNKVSGFTLVELLIVIALIAILSVAVLATINPIEQTNKARDSKYKNDAAEVLSAYERYYASKNSYPWNLAGTTISPSQSVVLVSTATNFGVASTDVGNSWGELITASELKGSFVNKEPFSQSAKADDLFYTYFDGSNSNYVCYVPKAGVNRKDARLKCLTALGTGGSLASLGQGGCSTIPSTDAAWGNAAVGTTAFFLCVPE
jgi:prepilin-type N-terminal cleavage/methylation domain-containing protein